MHRGHVPADKGLEDRLRAKFRRKALTVNDAVELEEILGGILPEFETVAQILTLLEELGIKTNSDVGRKGTD